MRNSVQIVTYAVNCACTHTRSRRIKHETGKPLFYFYIFSFSCVSRKSTGNLFHKHWLCRCHLQNTQFSEHQNYALVIFWQWGKLYIYTHTHTRYIHVTIVGITSSFSFLPCSEKPFIFLQKKIGTLWKFNKSFLHHKSLSVVLYCRKHQTHNPFAPHRTLPMVGSLLQKTFSNYSLG